MLSIFTIPKAFVGLNAIIQRNAIRSWQQLRPQCEIIIFGNDTGVADIARELDVVYIPSIEKNKYDTPLLSSAFFTAQKIAKYDILMYINSDIILFHNLIESV